MQADRSADVARLAGTVRGLGVCDVLRVELAACQQSALARELQRRAAVVKGELRALEARRLPRRRSAEESELTRLRTEARVLARVRGALPGDACTPFVLVAPAGLVVELVTACLRTVVATLAAGLGEGPAHSAAAVGPLEATAAWIRTALDCRAVEAFCLEPGVDPLRAR